MARGSVQTHAAGAIADGGRPVAEHTEHPDITGQDIQGGEHVAAVVDGVADCLVVPAATGRERPGTLQGPGDDVQTGGGIGPFSGIVGIVEQHRLPPERRFVLDPAQDVVATERLRPHPRRLDMRSAVFVDRLLCMMPLAAVTEPMAGAAERRSPLDALNSGTHLAPRLRIGVMLSAWVNRVPRAQYSSARKFGVPASETSTVVAPGLAPSLLPVKVPNSARVISLVRHFARASCSGSPVTGWYPPGTKGRLHFPARGLASISVAA